MFLGTCARLNHSGDDLLARVGNETITEKDFLQALDPKLKTTYLQFKKQQLDKMIAQKMLNQEALRRKIPLQDLLTAEVFSRAPISHAEIHDYYEKNKKQFKNKKHEEADKEIQKILENQKNQVWLKKFLAELAPKSEIKYFLIEGTGSQTEAGKK